MPLILTIADLIVILILFGLWLLLLRVLKIPWSLKSTTLDQAKQLVFLNDAFILLMAGALWMITWATAQFTGNREFAFLVVGIAFLSLGVFFLIRGLRWKAGDKP